jgi:hypothetical protein
VGGRAGWRWEVDAMSITVEERSESLLHRGRELRRMPVWLAVVLLLAVLGAGVLVGRVTKAEPPPPRDLASAATNAWIRDHVAAINSGDAARVRPFYADNATVYDIGNQHSAPLVGGANIARAVAASHSMLGAFMNEPGTAVQYGQFIAYVGSWGDVKAGVIVYELDAQGKILNLWAIHPAQ